MTEIRVDFGHKLGRIKPLHGFNNAARKTDYGEVLPDFLKLSPPVIRLHDTGGNYGGSHYVDIPNIFPDFSADADDPASYDFTLTDCYIKPLVEAGVGIMYRLGVTIEHEPKKYHIFAPADPEKWAYICEHIVRHYNNGWANGFYWNIEYWEIWNEPDGTDPKVEPFGPPNWIGTAEEYYNLYSVTANHIKKHHPEVKVGGYSSCYILGANIDGKWTPGPYKYFTDFLSYISSDKTKAPLDFFSWHGYLSRQYLEKIEIESNFVDKILNEYGFNDTLRFDTEWNCCICDKDTPEYRTEYYINMRTNKGASHVAGSLYEMQRLKIDSAMFYDAQLWCEYGCLFEVPSLKPSKTYYAFRQFQELYKLGNHVFSESRDNIYSLAASGDYELICISNISNETKSVNLTVDNAKHKNAEVFRLDEILDYEKAECFTLKSENIIDLPPYSFLSIRLKG